MKIQINNKQNVYFCSDPHYHHSSLVRGTSNWEDKSPCRNFKTLEEHDKTLVDNINSTVQENDILFCLGDWAFGKFQDTLEKGIEFRNKINCKNIHLVWGNHDKKLKVDEFTKLFLSTSDYLEIYVIEQSKIQGIKPLKQPIIMSHYPIRSWNKMRKGSFMLHGHCHASLPDLIINGKIAKTMDVGFDTDIEFKPYSYQEIKEIMNNRSIVTEDHH